MIKTLICLSLVISLLFVSSCRQKKPDVAMELEHTVIVQTDQDTTNELEEEIPFTPPSDAFEIRIEYFEGNDRVIKDSGIHVTLEWPGSIMYAWANEEQLEFLRNNGVEAYGKWEWRESTSFEQLKTTKEREFIKDPYRSAWNKEFSDGTYPGLRRFYADLNGDDTPELILPIQGGSGGSMNLIFQILPNGYYYLGSFFSMNYQILPDKTNGFHDMMVRTSGELSHLYCLKFNGYYYEAVKEMLATIMDLGKEDFFHPEIEPEWEHHDGDELQWSPRDDDKYR